MPAPAQAARPTRMDLPPSPSLSILRNNPKSFHGRKLGILVSDGVDANLLSSLKASAIREGAVVEIIAPTIGGVTDSKRTLISADHKVNGGPSVLFDAVAILVSEIGAGQLAKEATVKDFISDAYAHLKFIAFTGTSTPLLEKAGIGHALDEGTILIKQEQDTVRFLNACKNLRLWSREPRVKMAND